VARLGVVVTRLSRHIRQHSGVGITPAKMSALFTVEHLEPVTLGDLAAAEGVRPSSISQLVTALTEAGLLVRIAGDRDRRVSHVSLSQEGRQLLQRARRQRTVWLSRRLARLSSEEASLVLRCLPALERLVGSPP
jgi:DNA-binding MarR family transcriptional regulator